MALEVLKLPHNMVSDYVSTKLFFLNTSCYTQEAVAQKATQIEKLDFKT